MHLVSNIKNRLFEIIFKTIIQYFILGVLFADVNDKDTELNKDGDQISSATQESATTNEGESIDSKIDAVNEKMSIENEEIKSITERNTFEEEYDIILPRSTDFRPEEFEEFNSSVVRTNYIEFRR
jgi:hypothetical protein